MKKIFFYTIVFLGTLAIFAVVGSAVATEKYWWVKVLDFPRIQLLILAAIFLIIFLWLKESWDFWKALFVLGLLAAMGIEVYYIYPYSDLVDPRVASVSAEEAPAESTFDLVVVNVYLHNREVDELFKIIEEADPDMLLAMETNQWWENALQPLDDKYPYGMEYPLENTYGMILYSKYPLLEKEIMFLQYDSIPSFHAMVQLANGKLFGFHGVHPVPPFPGEPNDTRDKEVTLVKVGKMVEDKKLPSVVAGDLNDVAWARRERLFEQEGLLNDVRIGRAIINTYNAKSKIIRWPLDYVYVTQEFAVVDLRRLPDFGSDHFPLYIELSLLPEKEMEALNE